jgi:lipoprotein-releasing system ATP-binding protein
VRNKSLGFIYQFHHLLPEFTAMENVCMPLLIRGTNIAEAQKQAKTLLDRVGWDSVWNTSPANSRAANVNAALWRVRLVTRPSCVLGDEPTGNLDEDNAAQVYALMLELNREIGTSFILVTHDNRLAKRMDRTLELHNGELREKV